MESAGRHSVLLLYGVTLVPPDCLELDDYTTETAQANCDDTAAFASHVVVDHPAAVVFHGGAGRENETLFLPRGVPPSVCTSVMMFGVEFDTRV